MSTRSERERHRISDIHDYGLDTEHFIIYLQGVEDSPTSESEIEEPGIEYRAANRLIKNLDVLTGIDADRPITISMKIGGGDWSEGMSMHDAILATPNPISIVNYAEASSMSSIVFQAANKRVIMPHAIFMFHPGSLSEEGTYKQVNTEVAFSKNTMDQMLTIYADAIKRTPHSNMFNNTRTEVKKWLKDQMDKKEEVYMTSKDAIKHGFADEIFIDWEDVIVYKDWQADRK